MVHIHDGALKQQPMPNLHIHDGALKQQPMPNRIVPSRTKLKKNAEDKVVLLEVLLRSSSRRRIVSMNNRKSHDTSHGGDPAPGPPTDDSLLASVMRRCELAGQSHVLVHLPAAAAAADAAADADADADDAPAKKDERLAFLRSVDEVPLEMLSTYLRGALDEEARLKNFDPSTASDDDLIEPFAGESTSTTTTDPSELALLEEARKIGTSAGGRGRCLSTS